MKSLVALALLALSPAAHAADVTLLCQGSNLILGNLQKIEWSRESAKFEGTINGEAYSLDTTLERVYSGNGYAYNTTYGEVIIPFGLINGAEQQDSVQISNNDYRNEKSLCTRQ